MTVFEPVGKISKKVGIPICLFWVLAGVAIWFLSLPTSGNSIFDNVFSSVFTNVFVKAVTSFASLLGLLGTITWMIWGDY